MLNYLPSLHILSDQIPVIGQVDQSLQSITGGDFLGMTDVAVVQDHGVKFIAFFEAADFSEEGATTDRGHVKSFFQSNRGLRSLDTWMVSAMARNMEREKPPATSVPRPT